MKIVSAIAIFGLGGLSALGQPGGPPILTGEYNNFRTGANLNEPVLGTPANISVAIFGKIGALQVDGVVIAQPLYVPGVTINGTQFNVLYVATMHNSVYAFDADHLTAPVLWTVNLGPSVPAGTAGQCPAQFATGGELGILSTPAIDATTGTLYAVAASPSSPGHYIHQIFALDITTGQPKFGGVGAIAPTVQGTGVESVNGVVPMNTYRYIQRPALLLTNGTVYAGFGSCGPDPDPYHGWLVGFNAQNVQQQTVVFNASPNGAEAALWQSGRGPATDAQGNIYFMTGNGTDDLNGDLGNSFVKMSPAGALEGWFWPGNRVTLDQFDLDLGSSGPIIIPSKGLLLGGGKQGVVYLMNPKLMAQPSTAARQHFPATTPCHITFSGCQQIHSIVYWDNPKLPTLYVWGASDNLRAYRFSQGLFLTTPSSQNPAIAGYPGGQMVLAAPGTTSATAVLWAVTPPGVVHAYNATNVATELWNSTMYAARDLLGNASKFANPTIVNGKLYVPTADHEVVVYGPLSGSGSP